MPRPEPKMVTFEIDGREVSAPEGAMLVDGAKYGDVEIPYFCYEPRLGQPVGACRMCLVEIEGMPKLQTACSTPVKDGMVVITTSDRVKHAQNAVVEFLLVNHPLDCPVCDKGGECPLQDISYGWGPGRSRFIEPKRHFKKPLELSPLVAIDRERCILCYRCVRFSQEVAEDHQLVFLERGDHTFVGSHHGTPYVAPFSGNITELCPVGALTSTSYRFRARPWDIEAAGSVCLMCPAQCNVEFTVRDDMRVLRVNATPRMNEDVEDGWLCDKGRYGFQSIHSDKRVTTPIVREGGALLERSWEFALDRVAEALKKAGGKTAALVGGEASNEEGFLLQKLMREVLGSRNIDSRAGGALDPDQARVLARPELTATVPDIEFAGSVLVLETELIDEMPILELRVRKGRRRHGVQVAVATSHPSELDRDAAVTVRYAPGAAEAFLAALAAALDSDRAPGVGPRPETDDPAPAGEGSEALAGQQAGASEPDSGAAPGDLDSEASEATGGGFDDPGAPAPVSAPVREQSTRAGEDPLEGLARKAGASADDIRDVAAALRGGPVVIMWGERLSHGERGKQALDALLAVASALNIGHTEGSGLIEVPAGTNGRGLREVGCLPNLGPGLADAEGGLGAEEIAEQLAEGNLTSLVLVHADPFETHGHRDRWEAAFDRAGFVVAFANFMDGAIAEHADVILPAESYAEREGTVTHPDGRLQRVRQSIGHPGEVRPVWWQLAQILERLDASTGALGSAEVSEQLFEAVPFYNGITLEQIGGDGLRWQEHESASKLPEAEIPSGPLGAPPEPAGGDGLRLSARPRLWSGSHVRHSPVLQFLLSEPSAHLGTADAERLGLHPGERVRVGVNGTSVEATVELRAAVPEGTVVLHGATEGDGDTVEVKPA